jgi:hypothetical protein
MASPVYCWDEEALQNHRTRTRPNRLVVRVWGHHSGDGKEVWQKSMQGTQIPDTPRSFTAHVRKVFGFILEFRINAVSKRAVFETSIIFSAVGRQERPYESQNPYQNQSIKT